MNLFRKKAGHPEKKERAYAAEWVSRGNSLRAERQYEQALECYGKALALEPKDAGTWRHKGEALAMCFKYEQAIESCEKALDINPMDAGAWFLKAFAFEMLGQYEKALENINHGLDIDGNNVIALSKRGEYLYAIGRLEEALESVGRALSIDKESRYAKTVREKVSKWLKREGLEDGKVKQVMALLARDGYAEALTSYKKGLEVDARSTVKSFEKNYALAHLENPEKLLEEHAKAKREHQPQIVLELAQKQLQFGISSWTEVTLRNKGNAPAMDIRFDFPDKVRVQFLGGDSEAMAKGQQYHETIELGLVTELQPGEQTSKLISILPEESGYFVLNIVVTYMDSWGEQHRKEVPLWVNVFRPGEEMPRIPGYKIVWRMNSSDTADIYAARQNRDDTIVIIKIPRIAPGQVDLATEFLDGVKQWSRLQHVNIVKVLQFGDEPFLWLAMEYMAKGTLKRMAGKIGIMETVRTVIALAEAVSYTRQLRVTHRHVSMENVLLNNADVPKITNWGIGDTMRKLARSDARLRYVSVYSTPEQVSTEFGTPDWRTDVYQLGALLYEALTGRTPFQGEEDMLVRAITGDSPQNPSEVNRAIPKCLDPVIIRCLAKRKEDRYRDAQALKIELQKAAEAIRQGSE